MCQEGAAGRRLNHLSFSVSLKGFGNNHQITKTVLPSTPGPVSLFWEEQLNTQGGKATVTEEGAAPGKNGDTLTAALPSAGENLLSIRAQPGYSGEDPASRGLGRRPAVSELMTVNYFLYSQRVPARTNKGGTLVERVLRLVLLCGTGMCPGLLHSFPCISQGEETGFGATVGTVMTD